MKGTVSMKSKILIIFLVVILLAGIGTDIYFVQRANNVKTEISSVRDEKESVQQDIDSNKNNVSTSQADIDSAQSKVDALNSDLDEAKKQQDELSSKENGYLLENIEPTTLNVVAESANVLYGVGDDFDVVETLNKDASVEIDAKAIYLQETWYRIKDTTHFIKADNLSAMENE